jgi:predicted metal-dependent hydrolase
LKLEKKFKKFPQNYIVERYLLHFKNEKYLPENCRELAYRARDLASDMNVSVRLARVASKFIEFDVASEKEDLDPLLEILSPIGEIDNVRHVVEEHIEKDKGIEDGIFYFNNERFWECHEAFEGVWNQCYGREKELVQGIILVAVAFAHEQENEESIGIGMLGRALEKLGTSPSTYYSIDVDRIRKKAVEMQQVKKLTRFEI